MPEGGEEKMQGCVGGASKIELGGYLLDGWHAWHWGVDDGHVESKLRRVVLTVVQAVILPVRSA